MKDIYDIFKSFYLFILGDRESTNRGRAEREEESQAGSVLSAEPDVGLELTNREIMT